MRRRPLRTSVLATKRTWRSRKRQHGTLRPLWGQIIIRPMRIWVKPAGKGQFLYRWRDNWLGPTATPMLDAARHLRKVGRIDIEVLEMWHEGASTWALRSTVARAAKLTVHHDRFAAFKAWPVNHPLRASPRSGQDGLA